MLRKISGYNMQNIKLIAVDMDGTLLTDDKTITEKNKAAIQAADQAGIKVIIATGRMFEASVFYAQELHMNVPMVCFNGGQIRECLSGKVLQEQVMDPVLAQEILQYCHRVNLHTQIYCNGNVYTDKLDDNSRWYAKIIRRPVIEIGADLWEKQHHTYKILAITKTEDFAEQWLNLARKFDGKVDITTSNTNFLEILIPGVNKWDAVKNLAAQYNIQPNEIMCIGDSSNDLPMVANAGIGVAMGNATEDVKKAAKKIVADNNHDGVAEAIGMVLTVRTIWF